MLKLNLNLSIVLFVLTSALPAHATLVNWDFSGNISGGITHSISTFDEGDGFAFQIEFDSEQLGMRNQGSTQYFGDAIFETNGYIASDISAEIFISDAPGVIVVNIIGDDAIIPNANHINIGAVTPSRISINLILSNPAILSETLADNIFINSNIYDTAQMQIVFPSMGVVIGDINSINVSTVPVPAAVWLFGSALLGLFGINKRKVSL